MTIVDSSSNNIGAYTIYSSQTENKQFNVGKSASNVFNIVDQNNVGVYMDSGSNSFTSTSDERLKKDIIPLEEATNTLMKLKPCTYNWKNQTDDKTHVGFIAQEVEEILPNIVNENTYPDGNTYKGVAIDDLIPYLIQGMKEQHDKLSALEKIIN